MDSSRTDEGVAMDRTELADLTRCDVIKPRMVGGAIVDGDYTFVINDFEHGDTVSRTLFDKSVDYRRNGTQFWVFGITA